jgi:protein-tyrosine phosphatase
VLRVLLVCTGNICRSPLAHGFLDDRSRRYLGGAIEVRSAGTWARDGGPATGEGIAAGTEAGIDIEGHRSTRFTPDLAEWADVVVTMTGEQREEVVGASPSSASSTFTLKELVGLLRELPAPEGPISREVLLRRLRDAERARRERPPRLADEDVADPIGMSAMTYRGVAAEIEGLIDGLLHGLGAELEPAGTRES